VESVTVDGMRSEYQVPTIDAPLEISQTTHSGSSACRVRRATVKNLRTLGLAAVMAMALGAFVGAASASASVGIYISPSGPVQFEAEKYPTELTGSPEQAQATKFKLFGSEMVCKTTGFELEPMRLSTNTMPVLLSYLEGCTVEGRVEGKTVTVSEGTHCGFMDVVKERFAGTFSSGTAQLMCAPGVAGYEFTQTWGGATVCTVTVPPQVFGKNTVGFGPGGSGSSRYIAAVDELTNVTYTRTGPLCEGATGTFTNGTIDFTVHVTGS
jgi:hypothetical protein